MQYCEACDELVSEDAESCNACGGENLAEALQCVECECWVDAEDMDRNQLCGGQGNQCNEDETIVDSHEAKTIGFIMHLSQEMLKND